MAATLEQILDLVIRLQDSLAVAVSSAKLNPKQITIIQGLSEISESLGSMRAGEFIALSSGQDPQDSDGSGTFISANGRTFGTKTYHIGGVANGDLKWGANALTGELEAGDNAVRLTANGVSVYNGSTEVARLGNLNGFLGYSSDTYGIALGDSTHYMTYDPVNGVKVFGAFLNERELLHENRTYYVRTTPVAATVSIATPAVVSCVSHGLSVGDAVVFKTSGALPTGITEGEIYYVISAGYGADAFEFSTSVGGSPVNTSGSQSGSHTIQTGSDNNNGLTTTSPFLSISKALTVVATEIDMLKYFVTIQVADGVYLVTSEMSLSTCVGSTVVTIWGNLTTPANVVLRATANVFIFNSNGAQTSYSIRGFRYESTYSPVGQSAITVAKGSRVYFGTCEFGAGFTSHLFATEGGLLQATYNYSIIGGANYHFQCSERGEVKVIGKTITISGTPDFATAFVYAYNLGLCAASGITFTGSATGKKYSAQLNGVVYTGTGDVNYFPGDSAGTTAIGGQYY